MKKWAVLILASLLLSGCTQTKVEVDQLKINDKSVEYVSYNDKEWMELVNEINQVPTNGEGGIYTYDGGQARQMGKMAGYIEINNVNSEPSKKVLEIAKEYIGEELQALIDEAITSSEEEITLENTQGRYGLVCIKGKDRLSVFIVNQNINLEKEETKQFIETIKTDKFLISTLSVGEEDELIELITPVLYTRNEYGGNIYNTSAYYQLFKKIDGPLTKVRMVINQYDKNAMNEACFEPLKNATKMLQGSDAEIEEIIAAAKSVLEGTEVKQSGSTETVKYSVTKYEINNYYERLIEVVVEPKV